MYQQTIFNVAARFVRKEILDKVGYFDEKMITVDDYDLHNRMVATEYKVGRISAKEADMGVPGTLMELIENQFYGILLP